MKQLSKTNRIKKLLSSKWIQAWIFIVSVLFGLIISPTLGNIISPQINTAEKNLLILLALIALTLILAINVAFTINNQSVKKHKIALQQIEKLADGLGLKTEFLYESTVDPKRDAYTIVRELVEFAKEELFILDHRPSLSSTRFYDQTPPESTSRSNYYRELTEKALSTSENGNHFRYKRIVQLDEGPSDTWDMNINRDKSFADHCNKIIEHRNKNPKALSTIKTSRVFYPKSSILIADRKRVLIELAIIGPEGKAKVEGDLVFYDPEGKLAEPLRHLFEHIDDQSVLINKVIMSSEQAGV